MEASTHARRRAGTATRERASDGGSRGSRRRAGDARRLSEAPGVACTAPRIHAGADPSPTRQGPRSLQRPPRRQARQRASSETSAAPAPTSRRLRYARRAARGVRGGRVWGLRCSAPARESAVHERRCLCRCLSGDNKRARCLCGDDIKGLMRLPAGPGRLTKGLVGLDGWVCEAHGLSIRLPTALCRYFNQDKRLMNCNAWPRRHSERLAGRQAATPRLSQASKARRQGLSRGRRQGLPLGRGQGRGRSLSWGARRAGRVRYSQPAADSAAAASRGRISAAGVARRRSGCCVAHTHTHARTGPNPRTPSLASHCASGGADNLFIVPHL